MSVIQASAIRSIPQPTRVGLSLKPNPGTDGQTTWKASAASPPCAVGSVSGPRTFRNSTIEPGQPWVMTSGRASSCGDRTWRRWIASPSITGRSCGTAFSRRSVARQSY